MPGDGVDSVELDSQPASRDDGSPIDWKRPAILQAKESKKVAEKSRWNRLDQQQQQQAPASSRHTSRTP